MTESHISIKLENFTVPKTVSEKQRPIPAYAPQAVAIPPEDWDVWKAPILSARLFQLSEIPAVTLLKMCEDFKEEVFKRAGKSSYIHTNAVVERE